MREDSSNSRLDFMMDYTNPNTSFGPDSFFDVFFDQLADVSVSDHGNRDVLVRAVNTNDSRLDPGADHLLLYGKPHGQPASRKADGSFDVTGPNTNFVLLGDTNGPPR